MQMKKVALACTGGGIKACVNIGVLRALDELKIEVEAISGASLGALVCLLYLWDYPPKEILKMFEKDVIKFENFNILDMIGAVPSLILKGGLKNPKIMVEYVKRFEKAKNCQTFKGIEKPFIVPALDISNREIAYYSSKPLQGNYTYYCDRDISEAIRSSYAVPLLFTQHKVKMDDKNHFMLDGGIFKENYRENKRNVKNGAMYISAITNVPIIPVHITVRPKFFSKVMVTFGKPIFPNLEVLEDKKILREESKKLMNQIYEFGV